MQFTREIVLSPARFEQLHFSPFLIDAKPLANARAKQGGYGVHDRPFYVQRVANRGFHVLVISLSGQGLFTFEDESQVVVGAGEIFVSWAHGQGHSEQTIGEEPWEILWLTFWDDSPWFMASELDHEVFSFPTGTKIKETLLNLLEAEMYEDRHTSQMVELYEQILLVQLERALGWTESRDLSNHRLIFSNLWSKVAKYSDRPWTVEELCAELHYSRSQLSRICLRLYDKSPAQKVREMKMNMAELLLLNSGKTILEVSQAVGYQSLSTFSTAFSRFHGYSPRTYRQQHLQGEGQ